MSIAVYGGSFDPPHVAHVLAAHYALSVGLVDRVIVVPVFHHALEKPLSPFSLRLKMCKLAFLGDPRITVSDIESTLPEPSYTLHTLLALKKLHPNEELRLLVGADVLTEVEKWHAFEDVCRLAPPLVLGRAGATPSDGPPAILPQVSSTQARAWFRQDATEEDVEMRRQFIPKGVCHLIQSAGLYQSPRS